ncbi:FHA domain-containing protein [Solirubrobacter phytolaccae]|uniref:FHA domain-containing protein n=1 Tax=Solirubrobacter phytolaccae TaxID=1404360 RepID=A0A9X3SA40_9ACTN|nr:FHA domain-containing protein [Solirubrobacter phytolaccae]MDA0183243.1 FHA domain-containing protein [Solirubrobacter phytolaccae]
MSTPQEVKARLEAERAGAPFLLYRDATGTEHVHTLDGATTIGRRPERDVALAWDGEVSRLHAQLEPIGPDWTVVDDGLSRNGTFVNGERVNGRRRLRDGDRVVVGDTPIVFRAPRDVADSTAAITVERTVALTETQRRILIALCRPLQASAYATPATNKDIAAEVHLSVDAVKAHLRAIFERFGLDDLPQNQKRARLAAVALVNNVIRKHEF